MKRNILFVLLLILCAPVSARADNPPAGTKIFLDSNENAEDPKQGVTVTEWFIAPQTLLNLPACDPAKTELPLSVKDAVKIARDELNKKVKTPEKWSLDSVELHEIDSGKSGATIPESWQTTNTGKWYYKVIFSKPVDNDDIATKIYPPPYPVFILMDGTLAETRTRPQTKDEIQAEGQFVEGVKNAVKDSK